MRQDVEKQTIDGKTSTSKIGPMPSAQFVRPRPEVEGYAEDIRKDNLGF